MTFTTAVDDIEINDSVTIDLTVADANVLASHSVSRRAFGYHISDGGVQVQGQIASGRVTGGDTDIGVLADAVSITVTDNVGLDISVAEYGALTTGTALNATHSITDNRDAIQTAVNNADAALTSANTNSITVSNEGLVQLNASEFISIGSKFAASDIEVRDDLASLKSISSPGIPANALVTLEAEQSQDLTTDASFIANIDQIDLNGASNVTVDAAQVLKLQTVTTPETYNVTDAGVALIQLFEDGNSGLLSAATTVTSNSTSLSEAVKFNNSSDPLNVLVDSYQLSSATETFISTNPLTVVQAEAVVGIATTPYTIDDKFSAIKDALGSSAITTATSINALAQSVAEAVEIDESLPCRIFADHHIQDGKLNQSS